MRTRVRVRSRTRNSAGSVTVAGIRIADISFEDLAQDLRSSVEIQVPSPRESPESPVRLPRVYLAAHVASLNHAVDPQFRSMMNRSRITYADGMSVVLLARLAGAKRLGRMGTTDIGIPMLEAVRDGLGRTPRVAVVGGPVGLAEQAGAVLAVRAAVDVVYTTHGFHAKYDQVLTDLELAAPDVLVVGMGMPHEARWVDEHIARLLVPVIFTCGGWLGFLVGAEKRAPKLAQRAGFEWVWRLAQSPARLGPRYARGTLTVTRAGAEILAARVRRRPERG